MRIILQNTTYIGDYSHKLFVMYTFVPSWLFLINLPNIKTDRISCALRSLLHISSVVLKFYFCLRRCAEDAPAWKKFLPWVYTCIQSATTFAYNAAGLFLMIKFILGISMQNVQYYRLYCWCRTVLIYQGHKYWIYIQLSGRQALGTLFVFFQAGAYRIWE